MGPNSCQYSQINQLGLNSIVFFGRIRIYQLNHYDLELQNETCHYASDLGQIYWNLYKRRHTRG
jgi:hypothetical protein